VSVGSVVPGGIDIHFRGGRLPADHHGLHDTELKELFTRNEVDFDIVNLNHDGKAIPRIEFLPATDWRVIGNDNEIVAKGIKSKREADNRLEKHLYDLKLRLPMPAESGEHVAKLRAIAEEQARANARKTAKPA